MPAEQQITSSVNMEKEKIKLIQEAIEQLLLSYVEAQQRSEDNHATSFQIFKSVWLDYDFSQLLTITTIKTTHEEGMASIYKIMLSLCHAEEANNLIKRANMVGSSPASRDHNEASQNVALDDQRYLVQLGAFYCLYCIYFAQPGAQRVAIRIALEDQQILLDIWKVAKEKQIKDALAVLSSLQKTNAFALSSTTTTLQPAIASSSSGKLYPGFGVMELSAGLQGVDAAAVRELKFHLNSTLTGFGTANLEQMCNEYSQALDDVWRTASHDPNAAPPESVTDLEIGEMLHAYTHKKGEEAQNVLIKGKQGAVAVQDTAIVQRGSPPAAAASQAGPSSPHQRQQQAMAMDIDLPGVPGIARRVFMKEQARNQDMYNRALPWAQQLGVQVQPKPAPMEEIAVEDMPEIPFM